MTRALVTAEPLPDSLRAVLTQRVPHVRMAYGTGDLSAWMLGPDGSLRLQGVLGRVGQTVKVKGMFLHPRQVVNVMDGVLGVSEYRFVIDRHDHVDQLVCRVVADGSVPEQELVTALTARIRDGLRFRCEVRVVDDLGQGEGPMVDLRDWS